MRINMKRLVLLMVLCLTGWALAQEEHPTTHPAERNGAGQAHPVLPEHATWAGSMVIVILEMFLCAAVIGVVVRLNTPEQPPEPTSHDDHGHNQHGSDASSHGGGHGHGH